MISNNDLYACTASFRILLQTNQFICLRPHAGLKNHISNYNITFPTKSIMSDGFTEMPCGCATLSIENDGKNMFVTLDGPTARPCVVGNRANQLKMLVTIEFKPAGLYALTGIPQSELVGKTIAFGLIHAQLSKSLCEAVEKANSIAELVNSLDTLLLKHMVVAFQPQLIPALQAIVGCAGNINVKKLSANIHYSERQLNRIFKQQVGAGVKSFSRLIRVHNAFRLLKRPNSSLVLLSDGLGFHDLSHFIHDFKSVCGITPQAYRHNMSDFYINTTRF